MANAFLPITKEEMIKRGWEQPDFVYITGDAYVDHPSFGPAIISRLLEAHGFKVAMIPQPDWKDKKSIDVFGKPRLGFLVSAGNMDSMVNHYTVSKKRRSKDSYTPGGVMGKRPDYAVVVYCNLIRQTYKDVPIIIGGIEASLRRLAHYDYWSNKVKRSILMDSQADLLEYGMGEHATIEVAEALDAGIDIKDITYVAGTAYRAKNLDTVYDYIELPTYEEVCESKRTYAESFLIQYENTDAFTAKTLVESYGNRGYVVQNPPAKPLTQMEMDDVYKLPYQKTYHPIYEEAGGIPAIKEVKFSLVSNRGCFGGCNFCALTFHQGRIIQTRSHESIVEEAKEMTKDPDFKGYIHDVGGPTANFRQPACKKQMTKGVCKRKQCLFPTGCSNMEVDHSDYIALLRKLRKIPKVKKVFVRSGIRFDYVVYDKSDAFLRELCKYHVSGQLKVAPEHISNRVLEKLGKPNHEVYLKFVEKYIKMNDELGMDQYLVPYLMSSHPGSTLKDAIELALYLKEINHQPEQVQDFYPTPMTLSTTMYYTGLDPRTMQPVYVPRSPQEKQMQRALMQYKNPANYDIVVEALKKAGRMDLIGYGPQCLLRPRKEGANVSAKARGKKKTIRSAGKGRKKR
ncbi:MAG: YgiQ family radical SAM protein [Lachnospiraceae bacterium]|nr:YgiQ family radical SAM protein [Lachnospiraceae bacterium]